MSTEILINVRPNQTRVAYVEERTLVDFKVERKTQPTLVGSIYKGRVVRVLPGMQAAFVDIGLDRAAFLYVGDVRSDNEAKKHLVMMEEEDQEKTEEPIVLDPSATQAPEAVAETHMPLIQDLLKEGQTLMVQVAKDPLGTKGARITTHVSLPGRHLVYMPTLLHLGISRRIEDEQERERLRKLIEKAKPKGGVIVRTAGEGATAESLQSDLDFLHLVWKGIQQSYNKRKTLGLIHSELDVELRALRDMLNESVDHVIVDDPKVYRSVQGFVSQFMPNFKKKVRLYRDPAPLFDMYDIDLEVSRSIGRRIWLKSGGYLVIDEAEALVVIDVNTGRYVGKKDLEDTIVTTNVEAAKEVCHQLRIRNCGGIIIIDFIDMQKEVHREKVLSVLREELVNDRARTEVVNMSALGLVEMTRKRIRPSLVSLLCDPCPYCEGKGYIKKKPTIADEIFRTLEREEAVQAATGPLVVGCHAEVADWVYEEEPASLEELEKKLGRPVAFKVEPGFHLEQFELKSSE